jgi:hypothetical protein
VRAKERANTRIGRSAQRPLLLVDIDGVLSLFGPRELGPASALAGEGGDEAPVSGSFHAIDGIPHFLSSTAAANLLELEPFFELVWASGWEEKANEYLPHLLGLPAELPFLRFARSRGPGTSTHGHWKLDAIDAFAGERALAWVDDALDTACHEWAAARSSPTLLVGTRPEIGLTGLETRRLLEWAGGLAQT